MAIGAAVIVVCGAWAAFGKRSSNTAAPAKDKDTPEAKGEAVSLSGEQVYQRLIYSSALILTPTGSSGSGFVVDVEKRLVVTNYHVVGRENRVAVVFPLYEKGELVTDFRQYQAKIKDAALQGEVLTRDTGRDLAVIRVERFPERTFAVPLAPRAAPTGSVVYSVGGSGASDSNMLWRLTKGNVRGRGQRSVPVDFGVINCMILETDAPINPGDSGGPVMNDRGEVVAVVSHFNTKQRLVSGNIDVEEVRKFLTEKPPGK